MGDQLSLTMPQLKKRLLRLDRSMPIGIIAVTEPAMRKKGNPYFGRVLKISHINGWINFRYTRTVNRQRIRERKKPDFEAVPRTWGERVKQTPVVEYDGQHYLEVKIESRRSQIRDITTLAIIDLKAVAPFLIPIRPNRRQKLRRDVMLRDYRLDHIAQLSIDGQVWRNRKGWNQYQRLLCTAGAA